MDETLLKIVDICIRLEKVAYESYKSLASADIDEGIAHFFGSMAEEELEHIGFWESTRELVISGSMEDILEDEEKFLNDLEGTYIVAITLKEKLDSASDVRDIFQFAFYLETYLMRPAFATIFGFVKNVSNIKNPIDSYQTHLEKFIREFERQHIDSVELTSIANIIFLLYKENIELSKLSYLDVLSGLLNRRGLFSTMHTVAHLIQRDKKSCGVIMLDIDNFKMINDQYGHQMGDQVISSVGSIIRACIRGSDIAGRFGGEEFVIMLPDVSEVNLVQIAENIRKRVSSEFKDRIPITLSAGCAYAKNIIDPDTDVDRLVKMADSKMYISKREGKDRVTI
jgi:diguanylate cyclase (GGDEF)-like protein